MSIVKIAIIAVLAAVGAFGAYYFISHSHSKDTTTTPLNRQFAAWKTKYNKSYGGAEDKHRLAVFSDNHRFVEETNSNTRSFELEMNQFADLTHDEFAAIYLGLQKTVNHGETIRHNVTAVTEIDHTEKLNDVKNQGKCGSCWAFSAVGAVEGLFAVEKKSLFHLSEQQLVDCSKADHGCNGGWMTNAFSYIAQNGVSLTKLYPYKAVDDKCRGVQGPAFKIGSFKNVRVNDPEALRDAVAVQPVSVAVNARGTIQLYKGGIIDSNCGTALDHGVIVVGFGKEDGTEFWKVRNSWGGDYGEAGHFRVKIAKGSGICGINMAASVPVDARLPIDPIPSL